MGQSMAGSGSVDDRRYSTYRRSKRMSIIGLMRQDSFSQSSHTSDDHLALLIGECPIVLMRRPSEIITGVHKLLDFLSEG